MPLESTVIEENESDIRAHFEAKGLVIKTPAEIEAERTAAVSTAVKEANKQKADAVRDAHVNLENKLATLTGKQKPDGVQSLDWLETEFNAAKTVAPPNPAPGRDVELDTLKQNLQTANQNLETFKSTLEKEKKDAIKDAVTQGVRTSVGALPALGDTADSVKGTRKALETLLNSDYDWSYDPATRQLVAYQGETLQVNAATGSPYTLEELAREKYSYLLKPVLEAPEKKGGTGHKPLETKKTTSGDEGVVVQSKTAAVEEARKRGLVAGELQKFVKASMELSGIK